MSFTVTAQARADEEKRRKQRRDDDAMRRGEPADTMAHEAARGAMDGAERARDGLAGKAFADRGATEGPARPVTPGQIRPGEFTRPYESAGHGAQSPVNTVTSDGTPVPATTHVALTHQVGVVTELDPAHPMMPGGV
jgi:hypothetical protein